MGNRLCIDPIEIKFLSTNEKEYGILIKDDYDIYLIDNLSKNDVDNFDELIKCVLKYQPENWDIKEQLKESGCFSFNDFYDYEEMTEKIKQIEKGYRK